MFLSERAQIYELQRLIRLGLMGGLLCALFASQSCNPPSSAVRVRSNSVQSCSDEDAAKGLCTTSGTVENSAATEESFRQPNKKRIEIWKTWTSATVTDEVELLWQRQSGASSYGLTIGFDQECKSAMLSITDIPENRYTVNIASAGSYYICIDALNDMGQVILESVASFKLDVTGSSTTPVFSWSYLIGDFKLPVGFPNNRIASAIGGDATTTYAIDSEYSTCQKQAWTQSFAIDSTTGVLSGTPGISNIGSSCIVRIIARNGHRAISQQFTVTVSNSNAVPVLVSATVNNVGGVTGNGSSGTPYTFTLNEGDVVANATFVGTDSNAYDILSVSCPSAPSLVESVSQQPKVNFRPTNDHANQNFTFECHVTDSYELSVGSIYFDITVNNVNSAPTLTYTSHTNLSSITGSGTLANPYLAVMNEDQAGVQIYLNANDPDPTGDSVTISCSGAAGAMVTVDNALDKLVLVPTNSHVGQSLLECKGSDGSLDSAILYFSFIVVNTNDAPVVSLHSQANLEGFHGAGTAGDPYLVNVLVSSSSGYVKLTVGDPDLGQTPALSCSALPSYAILDSANKRINFITSAVSPSEPVSFSCKANDGTADSGLLFFKSRIVMASGTKLWEYNYLFNNRFDPQYAAMNAIAQDSSGRVYVAGSLTNRLHSHSTEDWVIKRYSSAGVEDTGFEIIHPEAAWADDRNRVHNMLIDGSDNIYACGTLKYYDYLLVKYNSSGQILWQQSGTGDFNAGCNALFMDASNRIYMGLRNSIIRYDSDGVVDSGFSISAAIGSHIIRSAAIASTGHLYVVGSGENLEGASTRDDWFMKKFDANGAEITSGWNKVWSTFDTNHSYGGDYATNVAVDGSGNVYVLGLGKNYINGTSGIDLILLKYNSSGAYQFERTFDAAPSSYSHYSSMKIDGSGNVYFTGTASSDVFVYKVTGANVLSWSKSFSAGVSNALAILASGDIMVAGSYSDTKGYNLKVLSPTGVEDTVNWNKTYVYYLYGSVSVASSYVDANDNVYIAGSGAYLLGSSSGSDWFIKKLDKFGAEVTTGWNKILDNGSASGASMIKADASGKIYVAGFGTNLLSGSSAADMLLKVFQPDGTEVASQQIIDDEGTGVMNIDSSGNLFHCYANSSTSIRIRKFDTTGAITNIVDVVEGTWWPSCDAILTDTAGSIYVCGKFNGAVSVSSSADLFVAKYASNGAQLWSHILDLGNYSICDGLSLDTKTGDLFAAGLSNISGSTSGYLMRVAADGTFDQSGWGNFVYTGIGSAIHVSSIGAPFVYFPSTYQSSYEAIIRRYELSGNVSPFTLEFSASANSGANGSVNSTRSLNSGDMVFSGSAWQKINIHGQKMLQVTSYSTP